MPSPAGRRWQRLFAFLRLRCKHYLVPFHWASAGIIKATETRRGHISFPATTGCNLKWINRGYLLGPEMRKMKLRLELNNFRLCKLLKGIMALTWRVTEDIEVDWQFKLSTVKVLNWLQKKPCHTIELQRKRPFHNSHTCSIPAGHRNQVNRIGQQTKSSEVALTSFSKGKHLERQISPHDSSKMEQRTLLRIDVYTNWMWLLQSEITEALIVARFEQNLAT